MDNTAHRVSASVPRGARRTQAGFRTHLLRREGCTFALSVRAAVEQGEDPDAVDYTGCSAVHVAAANGHDKILDILKKAGADMDKRDVNVSHCMSLVM